MSQGCRQPNLRAWPASVRNSGECYLQTLCREQYDSFGWDCRAAEVEVGAR